MANVFATSAATQIVSDVLKVFYGVPTPTPLPTAFFAKRPGLVSDVSNYTSSAVHTTPAVTSMSFPCVYVTAKHSSSRVRDFYIILLARHVDTSLRAGSMCAVSTPGFLRVGQGTKSIASSVKTEGAKHSPGSV